MSETPSQSSRLAAQLRSAADAIAAALRVVETGTVDSRRRIHRVDLALKRAEERMGEELPTHGTRGGSSSPGTVEENAERRRVVRQAAVDASDLPRLCRNVEQLSQRLDRLVNRQVEIVHEGKLPAEGVLPGCRSCARKETDNGLTVGGHFAPIYDKVPSAAAEGLCRECWEFKRATDGIPPVMWCHKHHTGKRTDANRWLAASFPKLLESIQRKAKEKPGITADDLELRTEDLIVG